MQIMYLSLRENGKIHMFGKMVYVELCGGHSLHLTKGERRLCHRVLGGLAVIWKLAAFVSHLLLKS